MRVGRQVERWQSPDGKHVLRLFSSGEKCFYFVELSEMTESEETFWATTRISDEYASPEDARTAALQQLPWLKDTV
jgi:hypothetical protein